MDIDGAYHYLFAICMYFWIECHCYLSCVLGIVLQMACSYIPSAIDAAYEVGYLSLPYSLAAGMTRIRTLDIRGEMPFSRATLDVVFREALLASKFRFGTALLRSFFKPFKGVTLSRELANVLVPAVVRSMSFEHLPCMMLEMYAMSMHLAMSRVKVSTCAAIEIDTSVSSAARSARRAIPVSARLTEFAVHHVDGRGGCIFGGEGEQLDASAVWFDLPRLRAMQAFVRARALPVLKDAIIDRMALEAFVEERVDLWLEAAASRAVHASAKVRRSRSQDDGVAPSSCRRAVGPDVDLIAPLITALAAWVHARGVGDVAIRQLMVAALYCALGELPGRGDAIGATGALRYRSNLWTSGAATVVRLLPADASVLECAKGVLGDWDSYFHTCLVEDTGLVHGSCDYCTYVNKLQANGVRMMRFLLAQQWAAIVANDVAAAKNEHRWVVNWRSSFLEAPLDGVADAAARFDTDIGVDTDGEDDGVGGTSTESDGSDAITSGSDDDSFHLGEEWFEAVPPPAMTRSPRPRRRRVGMNSIRQSCYPSSPSEFGNSDPKRQRRGG
jgi:hypothetical protein